MTKLSQIVDWNLRGDYLLVKYTSGNLTRHTLSFKEPKNLGPLRYFQEDQIFHSKLEATRNPVDLKPGRVALAGQGALIVSGETTEGVKSLARIGSNGRITWVGCFIALSASFLEQMERSMVQRSRLMSCNTMVT